MSCLGKMLPTFEDLGASQSPTSTVAYNEEAEVLAWDLIVPWTLQISNVFFSGFRGMTG